MKRLLTILITLTCGVFVCGDGPTCADPKKHDIGSAGQPTITGSVGDFVTGNSSLLADLVVTVNFGELTPVNPNGIIKVVVPIAIRSTTEYQVTVSLTGNFGSKPNSVQPSDVGFGIQNLRALGPRATACSANSVIKQPLQQRPGGLGHDRSGHGPRPVPIHARRRRSIHAANQLPSAVGLSGRGQLEEGPRQRPGFRHDTGGKTAVVRARRVLADADLQDDDGAELSM